MYEQYTCSVLTGAVGWLAYGGGGGGSMCFYGDNFALVWGVGIEINSCSSRVIECEK